MRLPRADLAFVMRLNQLVRAVIQAVVGFNRI